MRDGTTHSSASHHCSPDFFYGSARANRIDGLALELWTVGVRPVHMEEPSACGVGTLERVGTKVIALRLKQIGGQNGAAITVIVGKCGHERRAGDPGFGGHADHTAPARLSLLQLPVEVGIQGEIR